MEKLTLPYRLPTLRALAPTPSPLLQQRFMEKVTAPAPAGSRITPSSQEIRLRNTPTNSRGDPTRECEKQQHVAGTDRLRYFTARVSGKLDPGAPARHQIYLKALATLPEVEIHYGRFLAKTAWRPLANLPVAGRRIDAPSPVTLPQGNHRVVGVRPQTLPVGHYPNRRGGRGHPSREPRMPLRDAVVAEFHTMEEKGSDVNLAAHLLNDAWKELLDTAVVISNDTDQVVPVRMVTQERKRPVFVVCPGRWQIAPQSG